MASFRESLDDSLADPLATARYECRAHDQPPSEELQRDDWRSCHEASSYAKKRSKSHAWGIAPERAAEASGQMTLRAYLATPVRPMSLAIFTNELC